MLRIFNASAGSGKTYVLVKNYVLLIIKNYTNIKTILTITFTNQATQHIKDRIIIALYSLSTNTSSSLFQDIQGTLFWKNKKIQKHAKNALHYILNNYDYFNVSTIDSFLQSIIRSFNYELGIQYGYKIDIETGNAVNFIIEDLLEKMLKDPKILQWVSDFIGNNYQNEKTINIRSAIKQTVTNIFTEQFLKHENELASNFDQLNSHISIIHKEIKFFEQTMYNFAQNILSLIQRNGISINDFSYKDKGIISFPLKIVTQKIFTPSQRVLNSYTNISKWYDVTKSPNISIIIDELSAEYFKMMDFYFGNCQKYFTNKTINKTFYFYGIINELLDSLAKYRKQNNTMLISDVSNLLKQISGDNEVEFIYEKVGTYYNHFLIDEFQDISEYQWINIKTLVENSLSQGYVNMIVGDVKQSIYRWRGGDSKLLGCQLQKNFGRYAIVDELTNNFRSGRNIVSYNNTFFTQEKKKLFDDLSTQISEIEDKDIKTDLSSFLHEMNRMYDHIEQKGQKAITGEVIKVEIEDNEIFDKIYEIVKSLQKNGNHLNDITILVRTNLEGEKIMEYLTKQGVRTISNSMLKLSENIAVKLIINSLFFCKNLNRDDLILFEIASTYKAYHDKTDSILTLLDEVLKKLFIIPQSGSLYKTLLDILDVFEIEYEETIYTLLDVICEYECDNNNSTFEKWWKINNERFKVILDDNIDAIKIMTIHQSKGLEFKNIIMPFELSLNDNISKNDLQWFNSSYGFLPVYYGKNLKDTYFFKNYYEEYITRHYDNLNVIYVALTRAVEKMFLVYKKR